MNEKQYKIDELKPIENFDLELNKFDKKETTIEKAEIVQVPSTFTENKKQWVLKVESKVLASIGEGEDKFDIRASELFSLIQDNEGNLKGYPTHEKSNLMQFMKDIKAETPKDIIGKNASIKSYEKNSKTYLKFRY